MKLRQLISRLCILVAALTLTACGGGTSQPFENTSVNTCTLIPDSCIPGGSSNDSSGGITVDNGQRVASSVIRLLNHLDRMARTIVELGKIAALNPPDPLPVDTSVDTVILDNIPCDNPGDGGAYTMKWRLAPATGSDFINDTYTFEFANCEIFGETLNMSTVLTDFGSFDPTAPSWTMNANINLNPFEMGAVNNITDFTGILRNFTATFNSGNTEIEFGSLGTTMDYPDTGEAEQLGSYGMILSDEPGAGASTISHRWGNIAGTLNNSVTGGEISVSLVQTVDWFGANLAPSSGKLDVGGGVTSGMQIDISGTGDTANVTMTVTNADANGNSTVVNLSNSWANLLAGTNL